MTHNLTNIDLSDAVKNKTMSLYFVIAHAIFFIVYPLSYELSSGITHVISIFKYLFFYFL